MALRFGRFNPKKADLHEFVFNLGYLTAATLALSFLIPIAGEHFNLKPEEYQLGIGGASFTFKNPDRTELSHMYVSAAGSVDNPANSSQSNNQWSPWIDSGIKAAPGECLAIQATGSAHLSFRRIASEKLRPTLLFLDESPNYVGPDGTSDADITSQQRFLKNYSLFEEAPLGKLIARINPSQGDFSINIPFQVGKRVAYTVPSDAASGTLVFAVNDISFRKDDSIVYRRNRDDRSSGAKKNMEEAWLGVDKPELTLEAAQKYLRENKEITKLEDNYRERAKMLSLSDTDFRNWYRDHFWFNEVKYSIIYEANIDAWSSISPSDLLEKAKRMRRDRELLKVSVMTKNNDVWYKDNLGGYWVTVKKIPENKPCY